MKKVVIIFITVLCTTFTEEGDFLAQNLDSIYTLWQDASQTDSARVANYVQFIRDGYLYSDPDSAILLAEALHSFARLRNYPRAAAEGYVKQGIANTVLGNYPRALSCFEKALVLMEKTENEQGVATCMNSIGNIHFEQGNYTLALEYYQKTLAIDEALGDKQNIASDLNNIGSIYADQADYPRALEFFEKAMAIHEEIGNQLGIAYSLNNIGIISSYQGNFNRALEYQQKSLAIREEYEDEQGIAYTLFHIGDIYYDQGNYQKALTFCQKSAAIAEATGALLEQKDACQCLYNTYKKLKNDGQALSFLEKLKVIDDSLNVKETTKKLERMEFAKVMLQDSIANAEEARLVEMAHQTEVNEKNKTRNALIGSSLFLLLSALVLYSRWRYVNKAKNIIEKEKERSESLLLNILPAEIAEELKAKGRADARDFDMVSILFTDFKGFTEASARLSAQELVAEINSCFEAFDGIMTKYGIEKIKTIGDAYMAAGGLPVPKDDSVKNTVLAAIEMQAFIKHRKILNDSAGKPAFEMRVGIHTGPVVAGIVGVKKFAYDIWGDTVNTASRMESSGEVGRVNISQNTYTLIKDNPLFIFESRGLISAKGKGQMEMYFVNQ
jgi:adenylate cyclase